MRGERLEVSGFEIFFESEIWWDLVYQGRGCNSQKGNAKTRVGGVRFCPFSRKHLTNGTLDRRVLH